MIAYRKFSDSLKNETREASLPKPAKAPKVGPIERTRSETLGGLDALGVAAAGSRNLVPRPTAPEAVVPIIPAAANSEHNKLVDRADNGPKDWTEGFARLDPFAAPGDVPPMRWRRFVDDVRRFLDGPFCANAAALGWGALDLFGCDRDRPFARIDLAGLLWLLNGDRLVVFAENTATIEMKTGARQTYRRKPGEPGRVLAWELTP